MNQENKGKADEDSMLSAWMRSSTDFWSSMATMLSDAQGTFEKQDKMGNSSPDKIQESIASALKTWQTISAHMNEPGTMYSFSKGVNDLPETLIAMAQKGWERFFQMQKQWMEKAHNIGQKSEPFNFENLDKDALKTWTEIYDQEFKKYLNVPQLGLTRLYQEKACDFTDKFNTFQNAMSEFVYFLYLPMEKSFKVTSEKVEKLIEEGSTPESSKEYYTIWIKILEGHYMTLFKSPEYVQIMSKALRAMSDYTLAREELFSDILQMLPVATNKDLDELYMELYDLKKRLKKMEKKMEE